MEQAQRARKRSGTDDGASVQAAPIATAANAVRRPPLDRRRWPLYRQLAVTLCELIRDGVYEPGERLPSIRHLSRQFRVSINTVREAYTWLEDQRVVRARAQSGHFVLQVPGSDDHGARDEHGNAAAVATAGPRPATVHELTSEVMDDSKLPHMIGLAVADPPQHVLPMRALASSMARVLRRNGAAAAAYDSPPGAYQLRSTIAKRLFDSGCRVSADDITITSGCLEAITLTLLAVCKPGDTVLIETPTFFLFLQLMERLGLRVLEVPSSAQTGISVDAVEFALQHHEVAACILTPNFSNPLGSVVPDEHRPRLLALLAAANVTVIEDDIYGELYFGAARPRVLRSLDEEVVLCSSFSKSVAPGYRIGWVVGGAHVAAIRHAKRVTSIATATPTALAMADMLENGYDRQLRHIRRIYRASLAAMREVVLESFPPGTMVTDPSGGMVLWLELPAGSDVVRLYELARAQGISFAPGPMFSTSHRFNNCLRLNAVAQSPDVLAAVRRLGALAVQAAD